MKPPPCPVDVLAALRSCHISYAIADVMTRKEFFPIDWKRANRYSSVGPGRLKEMWRLGLLTSDPADDIEQLRKEKREQRQAHTRMLKRLRLMAVERQLVELEQRRKKLRKERDRLTSELEDGGTKTSGECKALKG